MQYPLAGSKSREADPTQFAALVQIAGSARVETAPQLLKIPIWAFHGALDDVIPVSGSQQIIDAIQAQDGNARLTVYPDAGHGICTLPFCEEALWSWLGAQRRP